MIKRLTLSFILFYFYSGLSAQLLIWSPEFAKDNDNITITVDAIKGNQGLLNFPGSVYVHVGVITNLSTGPSDWKYVKFTWGSSEAAAQATPAGTNKWAYTINNIRAFFNVPGGETIRKIAILFRSGGCNDCTVQRNADGSDMFVPVYDNNLAVRFNLPPIQPLYVPVPEPINKMVGDNIQITAVASATSNLTLYLDGNIIQSTPASTSISSNPVLSAAGNRQLVVHATDGLTSTHDTINFFVANVPNILEVPPGMKPGVNYETGNTSVVLVLYAPLKNRVSVIGSFSGNNWVEQLAYQMNKTPDGNYWWIRLTGLTTGTEYAFQYLVDGYLKVGDPYAEKILDPWNDPLIPASTYPGLVPYPAGATGIVSVLQTAAPGYNWQVTNFSRPDKRSLLIYELLPRDFVNAHDWNTIRDTLTYLKNLGVNAIEIMPFNEFDNNKSWGYNPSYYLAPDKYYGTKNALKRFIDSCHSKGLAVIMDIALNHATGASPLAALYWNAATNQPAANNPWFNETARHPFNVFNDFNHESPATKYYFSRVVEHWLTEYRIDGFRFDLSKGFTQFNSGGNVALWGQYDASRVAIWKGYYDTLQLKSPGSYVILEHFADNIEEKELSNYGMLFWGNHNKNFSQAAMGYSTPDPEGNTWNFEGGIFKVRGWTQPHLITYMESHDEERLMYKNIQYGNSSGTYNTKELGTALKRMEMSASFLSMIPGPKMIWQFGEMGYDYSINYCSNGTINPGCRTDEKPIRWDYLQHPSRKRTRDIYSSLLKLRAHPWYRAGFLTDRITHDFSGAFKWLQVTTDTSNLTLVGNFGVNQASGQVTFQNAGTWYDYLNGNTFTATGSPQTISLQAGEYHLYVNRNVTNAVTTPVTNITDSVKSFSFSVYPNPIVHDAIIEINNLNAGDAYVELYNSTGQKILLRALGNLGSGTHRIRFDKKEFDRLPAGVYIFRVSVKNEIESGKILLF